MCMKPNMPFSAKPSLPTTQKLVEKVKKDVLPMAKSAAKPVTGMLKKTSVFNSTPSLLSSNEGNLLF